MIDTIQIRKDIKYIDSQLFINSAGAALMPQSIFEKMAKYQEEELQMGGYAVEALRNSELDSLYTELAMLLNCQPHNFAYCYSASEAYSKAISSIPFQKGDYILTTDNDYLSNQIAFISFHKRFGVQIIRAKNSIIGDIDLEDFEEKIKKYAPKLIAITHIPTNSGLVQQAEEVGKLAKKYNILYLLDACQSVGQMPVDVQTIGCDFLNATGRKFLRGPRASGFLFVSDKALNMGLEPLLIDRCGADWDSEFGYSVLKTAKRFESQEISVAKYGLALAVKYANEIGLQNIYDHNLLLINRLINNLKDHPDIEILDKGNHLSAIFTFHLHGHDLNKIVTDLNENKITFSKSIKSFAILDFTKKKVDWAIRFSPHYFNTLSEIDKVCEVVLNVKK